MTDAVSYELLKGATVDYTTDLIRAAFEVADGQQLDVFVRSQQSFFCVNDPFYAVSMLSHIARVCFS